MPRSAESTAKVSFDGQTRDSLATTGLVSEPLLPKPVSPLIMSATKAVAAAEKTPLRVLHVIDRLGVGGTESGLLKVVQGLDSAEFEHRICAVRDIDEAWTRKNQLESKIEPFDQAGEGRQFLVGRLARLMRSFRPQIVHSRNWGAIEAIPAARLARVPLAIHSEHGYEVEMLGGLPFRRRVFRKAAYAMADAVFTVTEELRGYHARQAWISPARIGVFPNGVDTARFAPRAGQRVETRKQLGISQQCFVVGTIGRAVKIKDQLSLLRAVEAMPAGSFPVHVLIGGTGPELASLKEFAAASQKLSPCVTFLGAIANAPEILNALDVFVLPSLSEGMSNTLLEAMSSGLPVVATRVGGNPELLEENKSGLLFEPGDFRDLTMRLEKLSRDADLREELGKAARSRAVSQFSLQGMMARYRELYLNLAAGRRK